MELYSPAAAPSVFAATAGTPAAAGQPRPRTAPARLIYIDNIRWVMIMLVLSMHAAVTYSGHGSWYYNEPAHLGVAQDLTFLTYQEFLQSFFMGFLFFIAGYFVPGAYDKKGPAAFLRDRAWRLGLPSLLFIFVLQPLTCYYAAGLWDTTHGGFFGAYARYITQGRFLSGSGPLWFCVALLFFCAVYAFCRRFVRQVSRPRSFPRNAVIAALIGCTAIATFLVRVSWPMGSSFYNMQFCYFAEYIVFFIAGTLAYRRSWLSALPVATAKRWGYIGLLGGLLVWVLDLIFGGGVKNGAFYDGGWHWQSFGMSLLDALAGTGISLGILGLFQKKFDRQGRLAAFFSANAFAVYIFHTPVLIVITRLMTNLHWLPLLKFLLATVLCIIVTYAVCALVLRRLPLLKNML
jgi:fucose 4-O-acetylase-like acetyltransferase